MITNGGKEIISKYMLGQVNAYATHLAIGCGSMPLVSNEDGPRMDSLLNKQYLDFEMTRVPITSRGFVDNSKDYVAVGAELVSNVVTLETSISHDINAGETIIVAGLGDPYDGTHIVTESLPLSNQIRYIVAGEDGSSLGGTVRVSRTSISLTAEIPADNRYEITEIGLWSAPSNSLASNYDSRIFFNFSNSWQEHSTSISEPPIITNFGSTSFINQNVVPNRVFYAATDSEIFENTFRKNRKEGPRFLNRTLMVRGDSCKITGLAGEWVVSGATPQDFPVHVHLNNVNFDISRNSPSDRLLFAFSLFDKDSTGNPIPEEVRVLVEFFTSEAETTSGWAKLEMYIDGSEFQGNRYKVVDLPISQGIKEFDKITHTIISASGNGTLLTFNTDGAHNFKLGQEVTTDGTSLPINFKVSRTKIVEITSTSFSVESSTTGSVTVSDPEFSKANAWAYHNARFITATDFSAQNIRVCRVFATAMTDGVASADHYFAFDGMRLENTQTINPLYKMTGYSITRNPNGHPIIKEKNTNGFVEFRINFGAS